MARFDVYEVGGALIDSVDVLAGEWLHRANDYGYGRITIDGDLAATLLAPDVYVRVNDGTRDVFAFFPTGKPRSQAGRSTEVQLDGPGMLWLLTRALIYPESDCRPVTTRGFGPMSDAYTPDVDWTAPVSLGEHGDFPMGEGRGPGFADRNAHLISYTTSQSLTDTKFQHRAEFTLAEDTLVVIQAYGDDYYRTWLDSAPLDELRTSEQPYNWKRLQEWSGKLCAGTHVLYFEVANIDRTDVGNTTENPVYIAWSVMPAASDGKPQASHHAVTVSYSGTTGYWQGFVDGTATAQIAWDATEAEVQGAFDDALGDGEATVTGSTGSWTVTLDGPTYGYTPHAVSVDGTVSGLSLQTASYGASADYLAHSDTSTGVVLPPGNGTKGLTDWEILDTLIDEEIARGNTLLSHFTLGGTADLDVDGNSWPERVLEVPLDGANIGRVLDMLIEAGSKWDITPDLTMQGWVTRGDDLSATVIYTVGDGADVARAGSDAAGLTNVLRVVTEDGWAESTDATSVTTHGRAGATMRLDVYDEDRAGQFTPQFLADLKDPQEPVELNIPAEHALVPYGDYMMADVITAPAWATTGLVATPVRVLEIGGRVDGRSHDWTVRGTT